MSNSHQEKVCREISKQNRTVSIRFNLLVSLLLFGIAILFNQWTVGMLLSRKAVTNSALISFVWIVQAAALLAAASLFARRRRTPLKHYFFVFVILVLLFAFTILVDIVLGMAGFASLPQLKVAHPPSYSEIRKSIGEYEYEFVSNSLGLRYDEISLKKESSREQRVFVIGDSFVEGMGVSYKQVFTSILESRFCSPERTVRFINGGLAGTALPQQMQLLFHVGLKYDIDVVIVCVFANDVAGTTESLDFNPVIKRIQQPGGPAAAVHFIYPRLYTLASSIKNKPPDWQYMAKRRDIVKIARREALKRSIPQKEIDDWERRIPHDLLEAANRFEFNGSLLTCGLLRRDRWTMSLDIDTDSAKRRLSNLKKCLQFVKDQCQTKAIDVALVYIPAPFQYNAEFQEPSFPLVQCGADLRKSWLTGTSVLQQNLADWAEAADIPYLDLTGKFRKAQSEFDENINYPLDFHWTALGHRIAAEAIADWLRKDRLLQPEEQKE